MKNFDKPRMAQCSHLRKNTNNQCKLTVSSDSLPSWNLSFINTENYYSASQHLMSCEPARCECIPLQANEPASYQVNVRLRAKLIRFKLRMTSPDWLGNLYFFLLVKENETFSWQLLQPFSKVIFRFSIQSWLFTLWK